MEFYTASSEARPVRLPESIRQWAWDSLHGKYGDEAMHCPHVTLDDVPGFAQMTPLQQYDTAIARIAAEAPLRLHPGEQMAGAATLGDAIGHVVPACFDGKPVCASISHLTINFHRTLVRGLDSYADELEERLRDDTLSEDQLAFLHSLQNTLDAMHIWHERYLEATREAEPEVYERLQRVPFAPARTFAEALQSLWFVFSFVRLCGNWPGIGRLDVMLGDFLRNDLAKGRLTLEEARVLLAEFFVHGCEWIQSETPTGSGDAQHYQNIVLAGVDEFGRELTNEVTHLVLDVVEELAISDFPITLRVNSRTPEELLRHAARVMRHGGGIVAIYNEDLVLQAMQRAGYSVRQASRFANDGCWEVQVPGATSFSYMPFDALQLFDRALGVTGDGPAPTYGSTEELYSAFLQQLRETVQTLYRLTVTDTFVRTPGGGWANPSAPCCSVVSLFEDGCIAHARSYLALGPDFTVRSPHIGGAPDVGNSLYAIQKLVFEEHRMSLPQLVQALRDNWQGQETARLYARNRLTYYGNDNDEADAWVARVLNDFADIVTDCGMHTPPDAPQVRFVPGVSTFGRQLEWLPARRATAFGARQGEILAGNASPTPGTDVSGATAIIRSYCKADLVRQTTGSALDVKLFPDTLKGENGLAALCALMRGFVQLGGFFLQLDVMDAAVLRAAQQDPAAYKTLSVRVSGWNARFVTLDREWQEMIIERTAQHV